MYEPRNLPQLNEAISALSSMRFSIVYNNKYNKADDPDADPLHIHYSLLIVLNCFLIRFCSVEIECERTGHRVDLQGKHLSGMVFVIRTKCCI